MPTILDQIKAYKRDEVETRKAARPLEEITDLARAAPQVRGFAKALGSAATSGYGLIAEIKKASPSKGLIREDFDPMQLARAYESGGATCLSILTDTPSFQGADEFLTLAHGATTLPCLRKDFLHDPYQVVESRALGADAILLIMAMITDSEAHELEAIACDWGMDVLIEVHDEAELQRAQQLKSPLIGINNRNLHTFDVDLGTTRRLSRLVPEDRLIISESGLHTPADLADLARFGARCFLIGESLMREADVTAATRAILANPLMATTGGM